MTINGLSHIYFVYLLFLTLIIAVLTIAGVISQNISSNMFKYIFDKHTEKFKDTTEKMCSMHAKVVDAMKEMHGKVIDSNYHYKDYENIKASLHSVEKTLEEISFKIDEINKRLRL